MTFSVRPARPVTVHRSVPPAPAPSPEAPPRVVVPPPPPPPAPTRVKDTEVALSGTVYVVLV
ncbi:hypothetical protein B7R87_01900 [Streptomyces tsukubensis]|uniref:Uncharacterized protein n=1 Tax=Streptomyces tsukubensis (strain DSM 42081 / NBRC 108919 / NRRL 18488 / 9993) TaxID=1114943 RepID=A0A7G3UL99_STRT9|nr:hypothetical protein B7R87_01900 [Streptomyces tsukubensis]QKM71066.1 hypothetical protein STSU_031930 [Streptomyces tsukubensis NRRL18488]